MSTAFCRSPTPAPSAPRRPWVRGEIPSAREAPNASARFPLLAGERHSVASAPGLRERVRSARSPRQKRRRLGAPTSARGASTPSSPPAPDRSFLEPSPAAPDARARTYAGPTPAARRSIHTDPVDPPRRAARRARSGRPARTRPPTGRARAARFADAGLRVGSAANRLSRPQNAGVDARGLRVTSSHYGCSKLWTASEAWRA